MIAPPLGPSGGGSSSARHEEEGDEEDEDDEQDEQGEQGAAPAASDLGQAAHSADSERGGEVGGEDAVGAPLEDAAPRFQRITSHAVSEPPRATLFSLVPPFLCPHHFLPMPSPFDIFELSRGSLQVVRMDMIGRI